MPTAVNRHRPGLATSAESSAGSSAKSSARSEANRLLAFSRVVDQHKDQLVGYLYRLVGNRERAEDLAQETFLRLYQRGHNYEERGHIKAYVFRIATNLVRSEARRAVRWNRVRAFLDSGSSEPASQETHLLERERQRELATAIVALPLRYRAPLVLREIDGWPYRAISEALRCREGTVKSRVHRGKALLRQKLNPAKTETEEDR